MSDLKNLLAWETCEARVLYAYHDVAGERLRTELFRPPGEGGPDGWYIETHHYGFMAFMAGIKYGDPARCDLGLQTLEHGISRQNADGSFTCGDAHHSASFFLEALARFVLLAELNGTGDVTPYRDALRRGVTWFHKRSSWDDDWWRDTFHHRFFLNPSCLFLAWEALPGLPPSVLEQAYAWLAEGMRRQEPDGAITEFGGSDTGYQSLSITFMTGVLMVCNLHEPFRAKLTACLDRATAWLLARVDERGVIDGSENTRMTATSGELDRATGQLKGLKPYETAFALYGAGLLRDNSVAIESARRLLELRKEDMTSP